MDRLALPFVAVFAGVLSFSSPCCLPLLPGYLSYVSALPVADLNRRETRAVVLRGALGFVAGFTTVFTALGISVAIVGNFMLRHLPSLVRVSGVVIIAMGLATAGVIRIPFLYRERRFDLAGGSGPGVRGSYVLGMTFAFGWAPCIGPVLATILTAASATRTVALGAVLLILYSAGLGLPFIGLALGFHRVKGSVDWLKRHGRGIERVSGLLLVGVGVLFVSGAWRTFFIPLQRSFARFGWPPF